MTRHVRLAAAVTAVVLPVGLLTLGSAAAAGAPGAPGAGAAHAGVDAGDRVTTERRPDGTLSFVGVGAETALDHPAVRPSTPVVPAARAHLTRYGAALGTDRPGTRLVVESQTRTVSGHQVVRFAQRLDGVPVLGGEVVVSLRPDRELGSMLSTMSAGPARPAGGLAPARVAEPDAAARARAAAVRAAGPAGPGRGWTLEPQGRWVFDPSVFGAPTGVGARTVWRFEVRRGADVRRQVLVDDQTGRILLDQDQVAHLDRVVCDSANAVVSEDPCTSGFARTETGPASAVADVNTAFEMGGAVARFYDEIGGVDLTELLGVDVAGTPKLAATVRFCDDADQCPYPNAFWNGEQMFYGEGYADADDVVAHEMTHGVIDRYSRLFYWGQSGAVNESLADIMGEILDHRHPTPGDHPDSWSLGEDVPDIGPGGVRDLADPTVFGDPDMMTSPLYFHLPAEDPDADEGGVHSNSGVGNKTGHLIAKGGSFNGQQITGLDADNDTMTKTATLHLDVLQSLSSGSDYADLARVLQQSCQDLVAGAVAGFTPGDCTTVRRATLATELGTTPTNAAQPADAPATCPAGRSRRVLFDSETGDPESKLVPGASWGYGEAPDWGPNAHTDTDSWFTTADEPNASHSLVLARRVALPSGQPSFLHFHHWRVLDSVGRHYRDGGTVEVADLTTSTPPVDVAGLPWVNGPSQRLATDVDNPAAGRRSFAGDSLGYLASRLDLTGFAGHRIRPRFTIHTSAGEENIGWFLDDITVYTCDRPVRNHAAPRIRGTARVGRTLVVDPGLWTPARTRLSFAWLRDGRAIRRADLASYRLRPADRGARISVRVTGSKPGYRSLSRTARRSGAIR